MRPLVGLPKLCNENELIANWLLKLTAEHKRWGFGLCFLYLRNIENYSWNHKRVYRIYKELELNLRIKPRRRIKRDKPEALCIPHMINQTWSIDFVSDNLSDSRTFRSLNTQNAYIEKFNRTFREKLLDNYIFKSIEQVQLLATKWQWVYNNERPHSAI